MTSRFFVLAAAVFCCLSCVEVNNHLGGSLMPVTRTYDIYVKEAPIEDIQMRMADSLSGFSSTRVTIGAIRDEKYGLTTRSCALTLVPMFADTLDLGKNPKFKKMHIELTRDSSSVESPDQEVILQNFNVFELEKAINPKKEFNCNTSIAHKNKRISKTRPVYYGQDSLAFDFTKEFGEKFLSLKNEDVKDIDKYLEKFPGIYIDSDIPAGDGGRINMFNLQMEFNKEYNFLTGNYAFLNFEAEFDGKVKDTVLVFMIGMYDFYNVDSLFTNSTTYPQYCFNATGHETRSKAGKAGEEIMIEGGGGLKPVVTGKVLKKMAEDIISSTGEDPKTAIINKATLVFPFEFPDDYKEIDQFWPDQLSPTIRIATDSTVAFSSLSNTADESENKGDINRSLCQYSPDITYHLQQMLLIDENKPESIGMKNLEKGLYDVWLLIMADEVYTRETETNDEMAEYYNYLAYQSYYSGMYSGGYGSNYNNYYNYMMMANYANQTSSYQEVQTELDRDRYYRASLNGPAFDGRVPTLKLTFSIPKKEN
ncbi:MAG: DUF4270 domain-containing protein [Bacteroidales bacterium]|nr:DUF4270 domain-containing protein [Bacteroidales bacterium]